jgi:xylulokinase
MSTRAGFLLGLDVGSSSIKGAIIDADSSRTLAEASSPESELEINSPLPGFAEQDATVWWQNVKSALLKLRRANPTAYSGIRAIGISYQMHGMVVLDKNNKVLRPAIIWCDSRAVKFGEAAFQAIGEERALASLLNSPGNFTASKLAWVKENQPEIYSKVKTLLLPGDYIAFCFTGEISTTKSALSEAILWDYSAKSPAKFPLNYFGFSEDIIPKVQECFEVHGTISSQVADELGLAEDVVVSYRAGDQPNNAFSLGVLEPGEAATTAGTSGVVYAVSDKVRADKKSRVNTFLHVNNRLGVLLCLNGCGALYSWLRRSIAANYLGYEELNTLAQSVSPGGDGLLCSPFGNGAERMLENRQLGAAFLGIDFTRHSQAHLIRAAKEGIVYALAYGLELMGEIGVEVKSVRAGRANLFLSSLFRQIFCDVTGTTLEFVDTTGADGAARAAGVAVGIYKDASEATSRLKVLEQIEPGENAVLYRELYQNWRKMIVIDEI